VAHVVWLDDPAAQDAELVGAKASVLARLGSRFNVPQGFCMSALPFTATALLDHDLAVAGDAYYLLARRLSIRQPLVVVRSSCTIEDSLGGSYAGIFETRLGVAGVSHVLDAVASVYRSSVRVINGYPGDGTSRDRRMAVLIQPLVRADVGFVAASESPTSPDHSMVTATYGLPSLLTDGSIDPDIILLPRGANAALEYRIGSKQQMAYFHRHLRTVPTPISLRQRASLSSVAISQIRQLIHQLEEYLGWPVDVEGAIENDKIWVLQCRPLVRPPASR
jgi:phosphoenolpyruvate synthase/pyruvate phosphate dikinase